MEVYAWSRLRSTRAELERICKQTEREEEEDKEYSERQHECQEHTGAKQRVKGGCVRQQQLTMDRTSFGRVDIDAELDNSKLWSQFNSIGTEMVITKNGRRMFPPIISSITGLDPEGRYSIYVDFVPVNDYRYKFVQADSKWVPVGRVEKKLTYKDYLHPKSPSTGAEWMDKPVSFKMLKLTNNKKTEHGDQVVLNSMQKYHPRLRVVCHTDDSNPINKVFQFPETSFIAVTAYQNSEITSLKISHNPYAKAFREQLIDDDTKRCHHKAPPPKPPQWSAGRSARIGAGTEIKESRDVWSASSTTTQPSSPVPEFSPVPCYMVDEYSLYHSALILPPPELEEGISFSDPYLKQASKVRQEFLYCSASPVKPLKTSRRYLQQHEHHIYDDVFF